MTGTINRPTSCPIYPLRLGVFAGNIPFVVAPSGASHPLPILSSCPMFSFAQFAVKLAVYPSTVHRPLSSDIRPPSFPTSH